MKRQISTIWLSALYLLAESGIIVQYSTVQYIEYNQYHSTERQYK